MKKSLFHILFFLVSSLLTLVSAETFPADTLTHNINAQQRHVLLIYSAENTTHENIIKSLSENVRLKHPDILIRKITPEEEKKSLTKDADIIVSIGTASIQSANKHYPKIGKLFISTDPKQFELDSSTNKNDTVLYMSQPYCRQVRFIRSINDNWKIIGLLHSKEKPANIQNIQRCASNYGLQLYATQTTSVMNLSDDIRNTLEHSDVLLALPDLHIYNSRTVKNILLTSYRHRKPIIAFSKNFVSAGALAAIYSNTEQIGESASQLINYYFEHDYRFENPVNYPESFDISINRQVFKALRLLPPDVGNIKENLLDNDNKKSGHAE